MLRLLADENFVNLLRAEKIDKIDPAVRTPFASARAQRAA